MSEPGPWIIGTIPFVALLLAIAVVPLIHRCAKWWHSNLSKLAVAGVCSLATLAFMATTEGASATAGIAVHTVLHEYLPFMILIGSLFVVAGGLSIRAALRPTPLNNCVILAAGSVLASLVGTTAASVLLIRLLLETNRPRRNCAHSVVFFIFLVSNIGGALLPTGDPPLFLGYLQGVPFWWTLDLWRPWLFTTGLVLVIYYLIDLAKYRAERPLQSHADAPVREPTRIEGSINLLWLMGIIASAVLLVPGQEFVGTTTTVPEYLREGAMVVMAILSMATSPQQARKDNAFTFAPILEVAALFIGIFLTMQVPLAVLRENGSSLGIDSGAAYFWLTGSLSSLLDNAPTYLVFLTTASSLPSSAPTIALANGSHVGEGLLVAISLGAVFMGANTYIGNGPNFVVKAIAEDAGVKMPGFFGYMGWSCAVLLPIFVLVTVVFLM